MSATYQYYTYTWTGRAEDSLWSNAGNWSVFSYGGNDTPPSSDSVASVAPGTTNDYVNLQPGTIDTISANGGVGAIIYTGSENISSLTIAGDEYIGSQMVTTSETLVGMNDPVLGTPATLTTEGMSVGNATLVDLTLDSKNTDVSGTLNLTYADPKNATVSAVESLGSLDVLNGTLDLGTNDIAITDFYDGFEGTGNSANPMRGIVGSAGQVLLQAASFEPTMQISVDGGTPQTGSVTLDFGNIPVGLSVTKEFTITDATPGLTTAEFSLQTDTNGGNITDSNLFGNGVQAGSFVENSGTYEDYPPYYAPSPSSDSFTVTFNPTSIGALTGQTIHVLYNVDVGGLTANSAGFISGAFDRGVNIVLEGAGVSTVSAAPSVTGTPSVTSTGTPSVTSTGTPSVTSTGAPSVTSTGTSSVTSTGTPSVTSTGTPSVTSTGTPSVTSTGTPSVTSTGAPSVTSTGTSSVTSTGTPSVTSTGTPSVTGTGTPSVTSTGTQSVSSASGSSGNSSVTSSTSVGGGNSSVSSGSGSNTGTTSGAIPCFVAGTRLLDAHGEWRAVEHLRPGDRLRAKHVGVGVVTWIGQRQIRHGPPINIEPLAFGDAPRWRLRLSPDHAVYVDGVLIPVHKLVNGRTIRCDRSFDSVIYIHIELAQHDILFAEGLPCESFLDTGNRGQFDAECGVRPMYDSQRENMSGLDATLRAYRERGAAPLCLDGPIVDAVRLRLRARWARNGKHPQPIAAAG
jgi:hypothetical protein